VSASTASYAVNGITPGGLLPNASMAAVLAHQAVAEARAGGAEVMPAGENREDQPPPR
jgi:hypothetical protein